MSAPATFGRSRHFFSALPLVSMEKGLFERGKRNLLTSGRRQLLSIHIL